jgi:hypothetical protein
MFRVLILVSALLAVSGVMASTANPSISSKNLKKQFDSARPYPDLASAFYSVKGLQLLGEKLSSEAAQVYLNLFCCLPISNKS